MASRRNELRRQGASLRDPSAPLFPRIPSKPLNSNSTGCGFDCQPPNLPVNMNGKNSMSPDSTGNLLKGSTSGFCRICHDDDDKEDLIAPCYCTGTMGLIHRSCMQKWLTSSNTTACELCKCQIQLRARKRGVCEWMRWTVAEWGAERERHRGGHDESDGDGRHLLGDGICFMFLTPMALTSAGLCAKSAFGKQDQPWEAAGLTMLTVFLVAIYFIWIMMSLRFHLSQFRDWQQNNVDFFIAATPYPPQGGKVKSRLKGNTLDVRQMASFDNDADIRLLNPLPSFNAPTPQRCSTEANPSIAPVPLNDSVFVDWSSLRPNDASTPVEALVETNGDADPDITTPKRVIDDFVSVADGEFRVNVESEASSDRTLVNTCVANPMANACVTNPMVNASFAPNSLRNGDSGFGQLPFRTSTYNIMPRPPSENSPDTSRAFVERENRGGLTNAAVVDDRRCSLDFEKTLTPDDIQSVHEMMRGRRLVEELGGENCDPFALNTHERVRKYSYLAAVSHDPPPPPPSDEIPSVKRLRDYKPKTFKAKVAMGEIGRPEMLNQRHLHLREIRDAGSRRIHRCMEELASDPIGRLCEVASSRNNNNDDNNNFPAPSNDFSATQNCSASKVSVYI